MSRRAADDQRAETETGVRNRSQFADTLHRPDPDADKPLPACVESENRPDAEFTDVPVAAYPHY